VTHHFANADFSVALGEARQGFVGLIESVSVGAGHAGLAADELERRLLELGFVEGAPVEVLHEGAIGRDPLAVRVHGMTIALRRREAMAVRVRPFAKP
jgi:ferrous iron transport protein A